MTRRSPAPAVRRQPALPLIAALATVYVVWGSTYLAIRYAIDTIPPFLMAGTRFLVAGGLLYAVAVRRGDVAGDRVGAPQWRAGFAVGGLLLAGGNGLVSWGEQWVPTGIAALLIGSVPLWFALWARALNAERLGPQALAGLVVGFAGVAVLVRPTGGSTADLIGVLVTLLAACLWGLGSAWSRRAALPQRPLVSTAVQMLGGGAILWAVGLASGELAALDLAAVTPASLWALAYLVVFGSLLAFSAYTWLLRNARTSLTATYAYVNPVVAVFLGSAFLGEVITPRVLLGGGVILVAVALMASRRSPAPELPVTGRARSRPRWPGRTPAATPRPPSPPRACPEAGPHREGTARPSGPPRSGSGPGPRARGARSARRAR